MLRKIKKKSFEKIFETQQSSLIYFHENSIHAFDIEGKSLTENRPEIT